MVAARSIRIGVGLAPVHGPPIGGASTLQDNFDDNSKDTSKWGVDAAWRVPGEDTVGVTVSETNGRTEIVGPSATASNHFSGRVSAALYNLTDSEIVLHLGSSTGTMQDSAEDVYISFGQDTNNHYFAIVRNTSGVINLLLGYVLTSGVVVVSTISTGVSTVPPWLRLRHNTVANQVLLDTAGSGASNPPVSGDWTNQASMAPQAGIATGSGTVAFGAGTWASTTPTTFYFDGFNTATAGSVSSSTGTGAATEDADTTAALGTVAIAITGASTETSDTTTANGTASVSGSGASPESSDTTAASGTAAISASGASTEGTDTTAGAGTVATRATDASTEGTDTTSGAGAVSAIGSGAGVEATDTALGAGAASVAASGAATEGTDNGSGSGTVAQSGSTGTGASTEGADSTSGSGTAGISAAGAATEGSDTASGSSGLALVSGTGSALEATDICAGTGAVLSVSFGHVKLWMGTEFIAKPVKVWDGSAWVAKPLKTWTGSTWRATGY